jgi:glycosyltransferase involved in cell wall biosynthesis
MRILHVTPVYAPAWQFGGASRSVSRYNYGLAQLGHEVTVFTTNVGQNPELNLPLNCPVDLDGVRVYYFATQCASKFAYSTSLREACGKFIRDFDIVHLTSLWWYPEIAAWIEARRQQVPYVVSPTGGLSKYSLSQKSLKKYLYLKVAGRRILNHARAIHYKSELERELAEHLKLDPPSFIVPNGFNLAECEELPDQITARKHMRLPLENYTIVFLGRLHAVKNLHELVKAFAEVKKKITNVSLVLAGPDGGEEAALKSLAENLGVSGSVFFPGIILPEQRNFLLRSADLAALISLHENFGNAAVEAMLAEVPVMVTERVSICREVSRDGGGVVVPLDSEGMAKAIIHLLSDPDKLKEMGQVAAISARRRYGINAVAQQMATAYEDILTGNQSPGLSWESP